MSPSVIPLISGQYFSLSSCCETLNNCKPMGKSERIIISHREISTLIMHRSNWGWGKTIIREDFSDINCRYFFGRLSSVSVRSRSETRYVSNWELSSSFLWERKLEYLQVFSTSEINKVRQVSEVLCNSGVFSAGTLLICQCYVSTSFSVRAMRAFKPSLDHVFIWPRCFGYLKL